MAQKRNTSPKRTSATAESEALDSLNARARRRKTDTRRLIEATIEDKAKKRRSFERAASSMWKQTG